MTRFASNPYAIVSLVFAVAPLLLLPLYRPLIAVALQHLFPDAYLGASIDFLAVPFLLTLTVLGFGIAANVRGVRLSAQNVRPNVAELALLRSLLDVALFFFVWLPFATAAHS